MGIDSREAAVAHAESSWRQSTGWPAIGNHESHTASSANQTGVHFDNFTLPTMGEAGGVPSGTEAYYSFDDANIHFTPFVNHVVAEAAIRFLRDLIVDHGNLTLGSGQ